MFAKNSRKDRTAWKHSINHLICSPRLSQLVMAVPSCRANSWLPLTGHHHTRGFLWASHHHNPLYRLMRVPTGQNPFRLIYRRIERPGSSGVSVCLTVPMTLHWIHASAQHLKHLSGFTVIRLTNSLQEEVYLFSNVRIQIFRGEKQLSMSDVHRAEGRQVPSTPLHHSFAH